MITKSYFKGDEASASSLVGAAKNVKKLNILPSEDPLLCEFKNVDSGTMYNGPFQTLNMESLILGRNLEPKYGYSSYNYRTVNTFFDNCVNLSYFEIGKDIMDIGYLNLDKNENIQNIMVKSVRPPICSSQEFSKNAYLNCIVKVPSGYEDVYKTATTWRNFWNIEGVEIPTHIDSISDKILKCPIGIFNINGVLLKEQTNGLNIIKYSDGTTEKRYY